MKEYEKRLASLLSEARELSATPRVSQLLGKTLLALKTRMGFWDAVASLKRAGGLSSWRTNSVGMNTLYDLLSSYATQGILAASPNPDHDVLMQAYSVLSTWDVESGVRDIVEHFGDSSPCINCCLTGYEHTPAGKVHFFDDMDAICSLQPDDTGHTFVVCRCQVP